jgi:hypothetical protein
MVFSSSFLRCFARWLLGAMLLATLAPALSRTLAASRQAGDWVEVCTAQGMRWAQVEAEAVNPQAKSGATDALLQALDRCGHCALSADRFAPLIPALFAVASFDEPWPLPHQAEVLQRSISVLCPGARGPPRS